MNELVIFQDKSVRKTLITNGADVSFDSRVNYFMFQMRAPIDELFSTESAHKALIVRVSSVVTSQVCGEKELLLAQGAPEFSFWIVVLCLDVIGQ